MAIASKKIASAPAETAAPLDAVKVFEAASAPALELQANVRKAAEKGVEETRVAFERVKAAAEDASGSFEKSYTTASKGLLEFHGRAVDAMRANADAGFDFLKSIFTVKSVSEAITLNSEHARKQFEAVSFQAKDLATFAQKITTDAIEPIKSTFGKALAVKA